jgi:hypothetical protein
MPAHLWYPDGTNDPWKSWYDSQNKMVRARHDVVMRFLRAGHWRMDYFRTLEGFEDLSEIRITQGVAHRLIGRLDRNRNVFTVAMPCTHKGTRYTPKEAINTAAARIKEIEEGRVIAFYCEQPIPNCP